MPQSREGNGTQFEFQQNYFQRRFSYKKLENADFANKADFLRILPY